MFLTLPAVLGVYGPESESVVESSEHRLGAFSLDVSRFMAWTELARSACVLASFSMRVPSGAMSHSLRRRATNQLGVGVGRIAYTGHSLDNLIPIAIWLKLKLVAATEIGIQLVLVNKIKEVRIESHLISGHRVQEGRDALVEEVEDEGEVGDERSAESFWVMVLKDMQYLSGDRDGGIRSESGRLIVNEDDDALLTSGL